MLMAGVVAGVVALAVPWPAAGTTSGSRRQVVDTIIVHTIGGLSCVEGKVAFSSAPGDAGHCALDNNGTSIGIELVHGGDGIEPFGKR
jgi:hypothetical protein